MKKKSILFLIIFILSSFNFFLNVFSLNFHDDIIYEKNSFQSVNITDDRKVVINDKRNDDKITKSNDSKYITVKNSKVYKNDNYKGMLSITNSNFKEPLYQYTDNDYYLNHDGLGRKKSSGATYLDYRVTKDSNKILIYGHNNNSLSLPFSILENYNYYEYYKEHKYLTLSIDGYTYKYEIFSVYVETSNWDYMKINFSNRNSWVGHLNDLKNRSIYDTGVSVSSDDKILILQTCSKNSNYQKYSKKFLE